METKLKSRFSKPQIVAAATTSLFLIAIFALVSINNSNHSLKNLLKSNSLQSEKMLSEKLLLEKEIDKLEKELVMLSGKNIETDKFITNLKTKLAQKEAAINKMAGTKSSANKYKKEMDELKKMRFELEKEIERLTGQIAKLNTENQTLTGRIASLQAQNKEMSDRNELLSTIAATNFRVDATKGKNDKLTVVARQTKKLTLGFDVPESDIETIQFTIHTPDGKTVKEGRNLTINIASEPNETL